MTTPLHYAMALAHDIVLFTWDVLRNVIAPLIIAVIFVVLFWIAATIIIVSIMQGLGLL